MTPGVLAYRFADRSLVWTVALTLGGALLTSVFAQFEIPMWPVPITGQTLAVLVAGAALGMRIGVASQILYLIMGLVNAPVFSGGGFGVEHFVGPTVGYLIGFPIAAGLVGWLAEKRLDRTVMTAIVTFVLGTILIYATGMAGLMVVLDYGVAEAFAVGVVPFLIGGVIKAAIAATVLPLAWRLTDS
ncbi:MAG: biotin transporter BioY [Acidimicrobiia bacterium]|nr:biotin transporter BioY [Acidimicrobiia bacterium]